MMHKTKLYQLKEYLKRRKESAGVGNTGGAGSVPGGGLIASGGPFHFSGGRSVVKPKKLTKCEQFLHALQTNAANFYPPDKYRRLCRSCSANNGVIADYCSRHKRVP